MLFPVKPSTSTKKSTTTVSTTKRKKKKLKATAATSTTTTVATPDDRQPSTTTKAAKRIRKPKKPEPSFCSYPIGRLMKKVHRGEWSVSVDALAISCQILIIISIVKLTVLVQKYYVYFAYI